MNMDRIPYRKIHKRYLYLCSLDCDERTIVRVDSSDSLIDDLLVYFLAVSEEDESPLDTHFVAHTEGQSSS